MPKRRSISSWTRNTTRRWMGLSSAKTGDLSIVGWQIMALKSASSAKLSIPQSVLRDSDKFLESQAYRMAISLIQGGPATASMTSIGNLIRIVSSYSVTDPLFGELTTGLPNKLLSEVTYTTTITRHNSCFTSEETGGRIGTQT